MEDVKRTLEASLVRRCDSLNGGSLTRRNSPTRASEPTGLVKSCDSLAEMRVSDGNKAAYKAYWSVMSLGRKYNSSSREKKYGSFVSSKLRKFNSLLVKEEKMTSLLAAPADPVCLLPEPVVSTAYLLSCKTSWASIVSTCHYIYSYIFILNVLFYYVTVSHLLRM